MAERLDADQDALRLSWHEGLRMFREEVSSLVKTIPGPVASLSLKVGAWQLEITWAYPDSGDAEPAGVATALAGVRQAGAEPGEAVLAADEREVLAPIVGTFYVAPEPGTAPFVQKGDLIEAGQVVGIVEAMKLMNQVPTEWAGEVLEVLAADGESVEFGQPLVRIRLEQV
jgi:acetyl-CoA carboxylase biotin carboxyl carrier protein